MGLQMPEERNEGIALVRMAADVYVPPLHGVWLC